MEVLIIPAIIFLGLDGQSSAARSVAQAYSKHAGIERTVNQWQERELSQELRTVLGNSAWLAKSLTEQRVTLEWRFP